MSTSKRSAYHHGDLRAAVIEAALELLEEGDQLSLREAARRAGVSANAPYRHFADKDALLAALAARGFTELHEVLVAADSFVGMAQAYVRYAMEHPGLFRLMFGGACHRDDPAVAAAVGAVNEVLATRVGAVVSEERREPFMVGCWALVHGLASLVLDGGLSMAGHDEVAGMVSAVVGATLGTVDTRV